MKILVAEDEPNIAESYKLILEYKGHDVTITNDGQRCIDVYSDSIRLMASNKTSTAATSAFDLVILDYRMPKKDGVEVAQEILGMIPSQRILLATAYIQDLSITRLQEIPATRTVELIQKPFEFDVFLNLVNSQARINASLDTVIAGANNNDVRRESNETQLPNSTIHGASHEMNIEDVQSSQFHLDDTIGFSQDQCGL